MKQASVIWRRGDEGDAVKSDIAFTELLLFRIRRESDMTVNKIIITLNWRIFINIVSFKAVFI